MKPQDRIIVRVPADKKGENPTEQEGTILRMDAKKTAFVVKFDDGIMRTLPTVNFICYAGEAKAETPAPAAQVEKKEEPAQVQPATEETAEAPVIAPEQPAEVPVSEAAIQDELDKISDKKSKRKPKATPINKVGEEVHAAILEGKEPESPEAKKIVEGIKSAPVVDMKLTPGVPVKTANEVMAEAHTMAQEATEKLKALKGKKAEKQQNTGEITLTEDQKKILALDCKKHIKMFKLKGLGFTNKQIADLLETNAGHVWNALKKYELNPELEKEAAKI